MQERRATRQVPLYHWIWTSYLKAALIPLIVVELVFIGIYFVANNWSRLETTIYLQGEIRDELNQISSRETSVITQQLDGIAHAADLMRRRIASAIRTPSTATGEDKARLAMSPDGVWYTISDHPDGGAAVFYSGHVPIGDPEKQKTENILREQWFMKDLQQSEPLVVSLYINTFDSLNVIYPYFDVISQYAVHMDIPSYNFYYEADAAHNPERGVRWTDVYLDPAGHGWMASAIAPVYSDDFLEGVVGLDITVDTFTERILNLKLPWNGYGVLVGKDGTILALPRAGEAEWGLDELTSHEYSEAIMQDTYKPEQFNIYQRADMKDAGSSIAAAESGYTEFTLGGNDKVSSWATVPGTGWKLLLLVDKDSVFEGINTISSRLLTIGILMVIGLVLFYIIFFYVLSRRARAMSLDISQPLSEINRMVQRIGDGHYYQEEPNITVKELQETGRQLVLMGNRLGNLNEALLFTKEEAEKASHAKSRFLSSMSHELRTPLNAILGFAQVLEMNNADPLSEEQAECLNEIRQAGSHLLLLINEVLDLSGIEAGAPNLSIEPVPIETVVTESLDLVQQMARSVNVRLVQDMSCDAQYLMADRTRLKQVIINLLSNAIKYNRPDGEVRLSCTSDENGLLIAVSDTGIGIAKEDLEAIFTPFHRVGGSQHVEGTGIGLTVTRQLVELMNGTIRVESVPGEGSCFTISFPIDESAKGAAAEGREIEHALSNSNDMIEPVECRVLYIEDNLANTNLMTHILSRYPQVHLTTAISGEEGLVLAERASPDIVLLDIGLPGIDGFEVKRRLSQHQALADIPVLAVSANVLPTEIERATKLGFAGYMTKPIGVRQIITQINRLVTVRQGSMDE